MAVFHVRWGDQSLFIIDDAMPSVYEQREANGQRRASIQKETGRPEIDLEKHFAPNPFAKCELGVGQHYPRIFRPYGHSIRYPRVRSNSVQAVRTLFASLQVVLRVVEPTPANANAYGHELRQLLILACNEVESACRAVLIANGYRGQSSSPLTMRDYVKLLPLMRLDEWEVALSHYPDFPRFKPFGGWDAGRPTRSLTWYEDQHAVKHDREQSFEKATLANVLHALGAAFVLVHAQFGAFGRTGMNPEVDDYSVTSRPSWSLAEHYVPPRTGDRPQEPWQPVPHPALQGA